MSCSVFFFQAEDGIRYTSVTGVQTCALPISPSSGPHLPARARRTGPTPAPSARSYGARAGDTATTPRARRTGSREIGRASCRERVYTTGGDGAGRAQKRAQERHEGVV